MQLSQTSEGDYVIWPIIYSCECDVCNVKILLIISDEPNFHQMITVSPDVTISTCKKRDKVKLKEYRCGAGLELSNVKVRCLFLENRVEFRGLELRTLPL